MIKASFNKHTAFILWDNQLSEIIAIIRHDKPGKELDKVDVTARVMGAIEDHFRTEKVILPRRKIILEPHFEMTKKQARKYALFKRTYGHKFILILLLKNH